MLFASALCYWLIAWASQHIDPSYVSLWQVMQPITSGVLSFAFLGERMSPRQLGGGALICSALVVCCVASLSVERRIRGAPTERLVPLLNGRRSDYPAAAEEAAAAGGVATTASM